MTTIESFVTALPVEQEFRELSVPTSGRMFTTTHLSDHVLDKHYFKTTPTTKDWRFVLMPFWASWLMSGSRSIPTVHRCPQGKAVCSPIATQGTTGRKQDSHIYTAAEPVRWTRQSKTQRQSLTTRSGYESFPGAETFRNQQEVPQEVPQETQKEFPQENSEKHSDNMFKVNTYSRNKSQDTDFDGAGYQEVGLGCLRGHGCWLTIYRGHRQGD